MMTNSVGFLSFSSNGHITKPVVWAPSATTSMAILAYSSDFSDLFVSPRVFLEVRAVWDKEGSVMENLLSSIRCLTDGKKACGARALLHFSKAGVASDFLG